MLCITRTPGFSPIPSLNRISGLTLLILSSPFLLSHGLASGEVDLRFSHSGSGVTVAPPLSRSAL